ADSRWPFKEGSFSLSVECLVTRLLWVEDCWLINDLANAVEGEHEETDAAAWSGDGFIDVRRGPGRRLHHDAEVCHRQRALLCLARGRGRVYRRAADRPRQRAAGLHPRI